jgi:hypothetical protein
MGVITLPIPENFMEGGKPKERVENGENFTPHFFKK